MDATPCISDSNETKLFHNKIKIMCNKYNKNSYGRHVTYKISSTPIGILYTFLLHSNF